MKSIRRLPAVAVLAMIAMLAGLVSAPPAATSPPDRTVSEVAGLSVTDLRALLTQRKVTSVELVREYVRRIDSYDAAYDGQPGLSAVIAVTF
jgi:hypothetical protein